MSVLDDYLVGLTSPKRETVGHIYQLVRRWVPSATEEQYYGMPTFKYLGKGLLAVMATKQGLSLYPFCEIGRLRLGVRLSGFQGTNGSLHFSPDHPIPVDLLGAIVEARATLIEQQT
jgi:uncharacterized protein YdhG (YjbR/CyaY superfamily)